MDYAKPAEDPAPATGTTELPAAAQTIAQSIGHRVKAILAGCQE
jgi:hypothetical protein